MLLSIIFKFSNEIVHKRCMLINYLSGVQIMHAFMGVIIAFLKC